MERGIQYLRELAVREQIYYDLDNPQSPTDPDEVQCVRTVGQKFVQSTPSSYANSLAATGWKEEEAPTVNEVAGQLQQYKDNPSCLCTHVSAVERLSEKSENLFEKLLEKLDRSYSPPIQTSLSY